MVGLDEVVAVVLEFYKRLCVKGFQCIFLSLFKNLKPPSTSLLLKDSWQSLVPAPESHRSPYHLTDIKIEGLKMLKKAERDLRRVKRTFILLK